MSRLCAVLTIFWLTAVLVTAVYLRSEQDRLFYKRWSVRRQQSQLRQQLWQQQLVLEAKINPASILRIIESQQEENGSP